MAPRRGIAAPRRHRRCRVSLPCAWCTIPRSRSLALARAMLPLATALGAARRRDDRRDRWKGRCRPRRCCRTRRPRQDLAQRPSDRRHLWPAPVRQEAPSPVRDGLVHPPPRTVAVDAAGSQDRRIVRLRDCGIAGGRNVPTPFSAGAGWPVDLVCKYDVPGIDGGRLMRTRRIRWTMYPRYTTEGPSPSQRPDPTTWCSVPPITRGRWPTRTRQRRARPLVHGPPAGFKPFGEPWGGVLLDSCPIAA